MENQQQSSRLISFCGRSMNHQEQLPDDRSEPIFIFVVHIRLEIFGESHTHNLYIFELSSSYFDVARNGGGSKPIIINS